MLAQDQVAFGAQVAGPGTLEGLAAAWEGKRDVAALLVVEMSCAGNLAVGRFFGTSWPRQFFFLSQGIRMHALHLVNTGQLLVSSPSLQ